MDLFKIKTILIITFILITVFITNPITCYASSLKTPIITSFKAQTGEQRALRVEFNGNNTGNNYSIELINVTLKKTNNISGSAKYFVYQNLENNKQYKIIMRACQNGNYSCSEWTKPLTANLGNPSNQNSSLQTPVITTLTTNGSSITLNYKITDTVSGVEITNVTNNKKVITTNKKSYTITKLQRGTKYTFKIRTYKTLNGQKTYSNYSNTKSIKTKKLTIKKPSFKGLKAYDNKIKINYTKNANVTGVQIKNITTGRVIKTTNKSSYSWKGLKSGKNYKFKIRNYYKENNYTYYSSWSKVVSKSTDSIQKRVNKLKKYNSYKVLKTYSKSNMKKIATINSGYTEKVPQAFCYDGTNYIVQFSRYNQDTYGRLIAFNKKGKKVKVGPSIALGHANGLTCSPEKKYIYSVNRGQSSTSLLNRKTLKREQKKGLPGGAYAIAYDDYNNNFYITGGGQIRILNSDLKQIRSIKVKKNHAHAQDTGAYHGLVLQGYTENKAGTNYIDIYRAKDGAYLGSYKVSFGELESIVVDNGYLVLLINIVGTADDYIYKSESKLSLP